MVKVLSSEMGPLNPRRVHANSEIAMNPRNLSTNYPRSTTMTNDNSTGKTIQSYCRSQVDVSTQVELPNTTMVNLEWGRRITPLYSREDIKEQYCITSRQLDAVEKPSGGFFGCLSTKGPSPCSSARTSILSACVRSVSSEENLCDAPYPRRPTQIMYRQPYSWHSRYLPNSYHCFDDEADWIESSYLHRRPRSLYTRIDPKRYIWIPEDEESSRMEGLRPVLTTAMTTQVPQDLPIPKTKHVSFARSYTLTSFDMPRSKSPLGTQERLIDSQPTTQSTISPSSVSLGRPYVTTNRQVVILEKPVKRGAMKTQATQTELLSARMLAVSLSPRTIHRVKMVSQGAQTNGLLNGRKLTKSYSEASQLGTPLNGATETSDHHEPLHRTQSEEPPKSPFILDVTKSLFTIGNGKSENRRKSIELDDEEILIDFKPAPVSPDARALLERMLHPCENNMRLFKKTLSEGEIRIDRPAQSEWNYPHTCTRNHQNSWGRTIRPHIHFSSTPEDLPTWTIFTYPDDHQEEEFHENLVRRGLLRKRSVSLEDGVQGLCQGDILLPWSLPTSPTTTISVCNPQADRKMCYTTTGPRLIRMSSKTEEEDVCRQVEKYGVRKPSSIQITSHLYTGAMASPFVSSDSLANDATKDHSDGIWNESQATVLQADSVALLTPSSKRRHLLMLQHQQRSSMDTDAFDIDDDLDIQLPTKTLCYETPTTSYQQLTSTVPSTLPIRKPKIGFRRPSPIPMLSQPHSQSSSEFAQSLTRTDSGGRTNTDISETSTTEDYITANTSTETGTTTGTSATSSWSKQAHISTAASASTTTTTAEGSSFESASSIYSLARSEVVIEEPCSPTLILEETELLFKMEAPISPAGSTSSSSSGSYDLKDAILLPNPNVNLHQTDNGEENRSTVSVDWEAWSEEESHRRKKQFTLELSKTESSYPIDHTYFEDLDNPTTPGHTKHRNRSKFANNKSPHKINRKRDINPQLQERNLLSASSSLPRRRSRGNEEATHSSWLSPRKRYQRGSRNIGQRSALNDLQNMESRFKALSTESLRSVSPGSDSVFYSESAIDQSGSGVPINAPHCHHCGKEVPEEIVKPPAGFADSPDGHQVPTNSATKHTPGHRLYKKFDKRYRSEDRGDRRHRCSSTGHRSNIRAKSEERGGTTRSCSRESMEDRSLARRGLQVRSTDASLEILTGREDEDSYVETYTSAEWIYISDLEESHVWRRPNSKDDDDDQITDRNYLKEKRRDSQDSTESEKVFKKKYRTATHRMVHRKSSGEMYKRIQTRSFESDKGVVIRREAGGEFGFRIHGSKPVVVSAIEPDTPAESSGLEVGDIIMAVNGRSVMDATHSEVVRLAHSGTDILELDVARTCNVLAPRLMRSDCKDNAEEAALYSGYLWRRSTSSNNTDKWVRRWFALRRDNCLYYYKTDSDSQPLGAVMLLKYQVERTTGIKSHSFVVRKEGAPTLHLAADTEEAVVRWMNIVMDAVERNNKVDTWLEASLRMKDMPASAIKKPDCFGYLSKQQGHARKTSSPTGWSRRYCILKDAALYFYNDVNAEEAFGVACLHGFRVHGNATNSGGRKHAFELQPPDPTQRSYTFSTETEMDKKRWLAALEYSIDRWIKIG